MSITQGSHSSRGIYAGVTFGRGKTPHHTELVCQFLRCEYSNNGQLQSINLTSRGVGLGGDALALGSQLQYSTARNVNPRFLTPFLQFILFFCSWGLV